MGQSEHAAAISRPMIEKKKRKKRDENTRIREGEYSRHRSHLERVSEMSGEMVTTRTTCHDWAIGGWPGTGATSLHTVSLQYRVVTF